MGFTADNRLNIFARRPAPIQVNYMGYPGTMGADYIDYILADQTVIPDGERQFFSEQVVWLPNSYFANDRPARYFRTHADTRRMRLTGDRLRILLLQQQLQDHARDLRPMDAIAPDDRGQRAVAARDQYNGDGKSSG